MKWDIKYIEDENYVRIVYEGTFSVSEQEKAIEELLASEFWKPGMRILIDHRKFDFGNTNVSIMKEMSVFHQKNDARIGAGRIAVLMKSLSDFGRGRQFELLSEGKISAKLQIFLKEDEALGWLLAAADERAVGSTQEF